MQGMRRAMFLKNSFLHLSSAAAQQQQAGRRRNAATEQFCAFLNHCCALDLPRFIQKLHFCRKLQLYLIDFKFQHSSWNI